MVYERILVFVLSAVFFVLTMDLRIYLYDEGIVLTGAMRVAAGDIPHHDFYANYGPAQFYVLAALFKAFGETALVERIYDSIVRAMIVTLCYSLALRFSTRWLALAAAVVAALWLFILHDHAYPMLPVILLALASVQLLIPVLSGHPSRRRIILAGCLVGLIALFRYDVGFMVFAVLMAALWAAPLRRLRDRHGWKKAFSDSCSLVVGTAIVFLPVAIGYLAVAPIQAFFQDIFVLMPRHYVSTRSLPFPPVHHGLQSISDWIVYVPFLIWVAALMALRHSRLHSRAHDRLQSTAQALPSTTTWAMILLGVLSIILYLKGVVRVSATQVMASLMASLVLLAIATNVLLQSGRLSKLFVGTVWILVATTTAFTSASIGWWRLKTGSMFLSALLVQSAIVNPRVFDRNPQRQSGVREQFSTPELAVRRQYAIPDRPSMTNPGMRNATAPLCPNEELPRAACLMISPDRADAARFLIRNTAPDERIFSGLARHDRVYVNDVAIYFITARLPATHWHQFDPGVQNSAEIQKSIVADLEASAVRYVMLSSEWDSIAEPNESTQSSGVRLLDDYIRQNFKTVKRFGEIEILLRNRESFRAPPR